MPSGSFKNKFHASILPLNHTARSSSAYQLRASDFESERYGCISLVNKCSLDKNNILKESIKIKLLNDEEIRP